MTKTTTDLALMTRDILNHCGGDFDRAIGFVARSVGTCRRDDRETYLAIGDLLVTMAVDADLDAEVV